MNQFEESWSNFVSVCGSAMTTELLTSARHLFYTGGLAMLAAVNDISAEMGGERDEEIVTQLTDLNLYMQTYMEDTRKEAEFKRAMDAFPPSGSN